MWYYVALSKSLFFAVFECGTMWHYVALSKKLKKQQNHNFHENSCGTMWHYVALCGTMWHYQKNAKNTKIAIFHENSCGTMWHYVALSKSFIFVTFEHGTMWHYVALCGSIKKAKKHQNHQS